MSELIKQKLNLKALSKEKITPIAEELVEKSEKTSTLNKTESLASKEEAVPLESSGDESDTKKPEIKKISLRAIKKDGDKSEKKSQETSAPSSPDESGTKSEATQETDTENPEIINDTVLEDAKVDFKIETEEINGKLDSIPSSGETASKSEIILEDKETEDVDTNIIEKEIHGEAEEIEEVEKKPSNKISILGQISRKKEERIQASVDQELKEKQDLKQEELDKEEERKDPKKEVKFSNYESGFQKKSVNIIKKIQNFKYTPKTRTGFVVGLISLCVIFIASMMLIFPEKHSFSIYKASILEIYNGSQEVPIVQEPIPDPIVDIQPVVEPEPIITDEEKEAILGGANNNQDYSEMNVEQRTKQRLKNYLIDKYSQSQ